MTHAPLQMPIFAAALMGTLFAVTEVHAQPFMGPYSGPAYPPFYPPANAWNAPMGPMQPNVRERFGGWENAWEQWNNRMFGDTFANMFGDMGIDFEVDATVKAQGEMDARGSTQGQGVTRGSQRSNTLRYYGQPYVGPPPAMGNPYGWR